VNYVNPATLLCSLTGEKLKTKRRNRRKRVTWVNKQTASLCQRQIETFREMSNERGPVNAGPGEGREGGGWGVGKIIKIDSSMTHDAKRSAAAARGGRPGRWLRL
jgi:hypothetical protein